MTLQNKLTCCAGAAASVLAAILCIAQVTNGKPGWIIGLAVSIALAYALGRAGGLLE